jgi:alkanesulfonate monooxygenase SsuD/methylene tetrahydromethanopterin reductase-like flavin-dependent oxidoreductase (luciferase family)
MPATARRSASTAGIPTCTTRNCGVGSAGSTCRLSHDEPFSWEGKHYTHRHVNIWPPPYQRPHPPFWAATGDPETSGELGRRGIVNALVLRGPEASKRAFDAYRAARREAGMPAISGSSKSRLAANARSRRSARCCWKTKQAGSISPAAEPPTD